MSRLALVGILVASLFTGAVAAAALRVDDPRIVPWYMIGNVGIGMSRSRVEYAYGAPSTADFYDVHGGFANLEVVYTNGLVSYLLLTSPYYKTAGGIGVGSRIPLGRCHHKPGGGCVYRWNGFTYAGGFASTPGAGEWHRWTKGPAGRVYVILATRAGTVRSILLVSSRFIP